jgi:protein-L-isoaspartate(D-aspartate) O-methyltransferase
MKNPEGLGLWKKKDALIDRLISMGYLKTPTVISAMDEVGRENFLPEGMEKFAYDDSPLPIGGSQTISAPHMVAIMCENAEFEAGQKVLEIGAGSGYHACVTSKITGKMVFSVERVDELAKDAKNNLKKAGCEKVTVLVGDGTLGYEKEAPYDRIIVTAGAPDIPEPLIEQLKNGGKLLIPVGSRSSQELMRITKQKGELKKERLGGCIFVPLLGKHGWSE